MSSWTTVFTVLNVLTGNRSNNVLHMEIEAAGTQFGASPVAQAAFGTLFDGNRWMIVRNALTGILHWDFVSNLFIVPQNAGSEPTHISPSLGASLSFLLQIISE